MFYYNYIYITDSCLQELESFNEVRPMFGYGSFKTKEEFGDNKLFESMDTIFKTSRKYNIKNECKNLRSCKDMEDYVLDKLKKEYKFIQSGFFLSNKKCYNTNDIEEVWKEIMIKVIEYQMDYRLSNM
jgi:hypothetical protein